MKKGSGKKAQAVEPQEFRHLSLPHMPKETYYLLRGLVEEMGALTGCNPKRPYAKWDMFALWAKHQRDSGEFHKFARGE